MLKTVFSLLVLIATTVVCFGQSASRAEMRGTTVNTLDTISELISWSPQPSTVGTNMVFVKAHSGTNGLGGGLFELRGTNGYATNRGTIFASTAPRKFWFRVNPTPLNPEWFGAKHDSSTVDNIPVQSMLDLMTNGNSVAAIPAGRYRLTTRLVLTNHSPGTSFRISGQTGVGRTPDGAVFAWDSTPGTNCFRIVGANNSSIENMGFLFDTNKYGIHLDSTAIEIPGTPGSSGMQFINCVFSGTSGAGSAQVAMSHVTGGNTAQISEVTWRDCFFSGGITSGSDHAVINLVGANCKQFAFYNCRALEFTNAFNFLSGSSIVRFDNMVGGYHQTGIVAQVSQLEVNGWYDEGSSNFLYMSSSGANPVSAKLSAVEWHGSAHAGNGDEIIHVQGRLIIENSLFENNRTTTSQPNIVLDSPETRNQVYGSAINSMGNLFVRCTVPPFYGNGSGLGASSTNNWLFHMFDFSQSATYGDFANTNASAVSMNDGGWTSGATTKFKSYFHAGGNTIVDYLHVIGTMFAWSNNVIFLNIPSNAAPVAALGVDSGGRVYKVSHGGGSGSGNFSTNSSGDALFTGTLAVTNTGSTASIERGVGLNSGQVRIRTFIGDIFGGGSYTWQWIERTNEVFLQTGPSDLDFPFHYIRDTDTMKVGRTNGTTLVPGNLEVVGNASFGSFTTPRLIILSNTVEMTTGVAWTNADLMSGSRTFIFTNWLGGNKVFQITNIAGTTNSEIEGVFIADGSDRFVTNQFASIGGTIPILVHNMSGAAADPPFVLKVPANTKVEFNYKVHSEINGAITNFVKCNTNIIAK